MLTVSQELSESLRSAKGKLYAVKCDVSKECDINTTFKWVKNNLGGVDILVNNAGVLAHSNLTGKSPFQLLVVLMVWFLKAPSQNCEKWPSASSCLSVRPYGTTRLPLDGFSWNLVCEYYWKCDEKIQVSLKSDNNNTYFTWWPTYVYDHSSFSSS